MRSGEGMPRAAITMVSAVTATNKVVTCGFMRFKYARKTPERFPGARASSTCMLSAEGSAILLMAELTFVIEE